MTVFVAIQPVPPRRGGTREPLPSLDGVERLEHPAVGRARMQAEPWVGKTRPAMYEDSPYKHIEPQEPA